MTNWLTTTEASTLLGRSPRAVQHLIKRGLLEATRFGRDWQVSRESVLAWRESHEGQEKRGRKAAMTIEMRSRGGYFDMPPHMDPERLTTVVVGSPDTSWSWLQPGSL